ncbi:uncharacterized protein [Mytilus edulis]|uniref:uncharacterized protein n=1 Tax=Mytilus edulis TaxID=6550 RepID=UPI0039F11BCF
MGTMCKLCAWCKKVFNNLPDYILIITFLIYLSSGVSSQFSVDLQSRIQSARNNSCVNCKRILDISIAEKRRLDILLKRIKDRLGIEPNRKVAQETNAKPRDSQYVQPKYTYPETSEIVSFPEKQDNTTGKNTLLFTIDVRNNPGPLEAIKAHLWILVKQRKQGRTRGKKIWLRVSQINDTNNINQYLTSIRTRVKKTRWQKIALPVTLIQSMIDNHEHALKLKISCKKCGKMVRLVLQRKRHRKRRHKGKNKTHKNRTTRKKRNRRPKNNDSVQPFLVISTRYKYKLKLM